MKLLICLCLCLIAIVLQFTQSTVRLKNKKYTHKRTHTEISDSLNQIKKGVFKDEVLELKSYGAIYKSTDGKFVLTKEKLNNSNVKLVAECFFSNVINEKGWDKVSINTYKSANAYQQAYMAGYLEGRMTSDGIFNFYNNLKLNNLRTHKTSWDKMDSFFHRVALSFSKRIHDLKKNPMKMSEKDRKFWSRIILGYTQLEGLVKGYNFEINRLGKFEEKKMTISDFLILQADGEVPELLRYFHSEPALEHNVKLGDENYFKEAFGINTKDPLIFWSQLMWTSKCSAFIKLSQDANGNWSDLLAGHTTWTQYYEMLRSYKHYNFELDDKGTFKKSEIIFSSYPGCISSTDDFFLTNHNLLVMETTLEVIDINLYKNVKSAEEYIPNFTRVLAATRFAKSANKWSDYFSKYNSGTYSSQWIIIDYKKFAQIKNTKNKVTNLLLMMEQTPNRIIYHDISKYLFTHKYFGSFNRAFLSETKDSLNMALVKNLYGKSFGYSGSNRAKIFEAMSYKVTDLKSMKDILRYNGYKLNNFANDPSAMHPGEGISARYDLDSIDMMNLSGGIDCKVTNFELAGKMTSIAISGPTNENNQNLKTFDWANTGDNETIRKGVPNKFNFPYLLMSPSTLCCDNIEDTYTFK